MWVEIEEKYVAILAENVYLELPNSAVCGSVGNCM